jgi:hypothetical protein
MASTHDTPPRRITAESPGWEGTRASHERGIAALQPEADPLAGLPLGLGDASARRLVVLPDGRTGRLVYWPPRDPRRRTKGAKAKVQLPSGQYVSLPPDQLERAPR